MIGSGGAAIGIEVHPHRMTIFLVGGCNHNKFIVFVTWYGDEEIAILVRFGFGYNASPIGLFAYHFSAARLPPSTSYFPKSNFMMSNFLEPSELVQ